MNEKLTTSLIDTILKHIPCNKNPAAYLAKLLNMEQEYVYRRLRGQTNFTIEEIVLLAKELKFSFDHVIGVKHDDVAIFNLTFLNKSCLDEILTRKLEINLDGIQMLSAAKHSSILWAGNTIPFMIFNKYTNLTKFFFYKWNYQKLTNVPNPSFINFEFTKETDRLLRTYRHNSLVNSNVSLILDDNFMLSVIRDINFFKIRGVLTKEETAELQAELYDILNTLEHDAIHGTSRLVGKVKIYLSAVNLSSSYTYVEYDNCCLSQLTIYTFNTLNSNDEVVCQMQKEWLKSILKTSTNITSCNEIERCKYFEKQREVVKSLEYGL